MSHAFFSCLFALLLLLPSLPVRADGPQPSPQALDTLPFFPQDTPLLLSVFPHRLLETSKDALSWLDRALPRSQGLGLPASPSWSAALQRVWERLAKERERLLVWNLVAQIDPGQPCLIAPFATEAGQLRQIEATGLLKASPEAIRTPVFSGFAHLGVLPLKDVSEALILLAEILQGRRFLPETGLQAALQRQSSRAQAWRLGKRLVLLLPEARSIRFLWTEPSLHTFAKNDKDAWLAYASGFVQRLVAQRSAPWRRTPALLSFLRSDRLLGLYLHPSGLQKHGVLFGLLEAYKALPSALKDQKLLLLGMYFQIAAIPMLALAAPLAEFEDLSFSLATTPIVRLDSVASLTEAGRFRYTAATSKQDSLPLPSPDALASLAWNFDLHALLRSPSQSSAYPWLASYFAGQPTPLIPSSAAKIYSDGGIFMHLILFVQGYAGFLDAILSPLPKEQRASIVPFLPPQGLFSVFPPLEGFPLPTLQAQVLLTPHDRPAFQKVLTKARTLLQGPFALSSPQTHPFGSKTCLSLSFPASAPPLGCPPHASRPLTPWFLRGHVSVDGLLRLATHAQRLGPLPPGLFDLLNALRTRFRSFHFGSRLTERAQIFTFVGHSATFSPPPLEESLPSLPLSPILPLSQDPAFHKKLACLSDARVALFRLRDLFVHASADQKAPLLAHLRPLSATFQESLRCLESDPSTANQRSALLQAWNSFFPPSPPPTSMPSSSPASPPSSRPISRPSTPLPSSKAP